MQSTLCCPLLFAKTFRAPPADTAEADASTSAVRRAHNSTPRRPHAAPPRRHPTCAPPVPETRLPHPYCVNLFGGPRSVVAGNQRRTRTRRSASLQRRYSIPSVQLPHRRFGKTLRLPPVDTSESDASTSAVRRALNSTARRTPAIPPRHRRPATQFDGVADVHGRDVQDVDGRRGGAVMTRVRDDACGAVQSWVLLDVVTKVSYIL